MVRSSLAYLMGLGILIGGNLSGLPPAHSNTVLAQNNQTFAVGDRLEIRRRGVWRPGEVLAIQQRNGTRVYRVRYMDVGFVENAVPSNRLRTNSTVVASSQPSQQQPIDLRQPIYVERNGEWQEARIRSRTFSSATGDRYTVRFIEDGAEKSNVRPNQIRTLAEAQNLGVATAIYDLSTEAGSQSIVDAHNAWRSPLGLPPLRWSDELANVAQNWADNLARRQVMQHSSNNGYGENLAAGSNAFLSAERVVNLWGNEVVDYDYASNSCTPGKMCGHYTQMVWENTTEVGCGMVRKDNGWEIWVCNYEPPGNYIGQRPY